MQATLARLITPPRVAVFQQFLRFGTVGFVGFLVDTAIVYALRGAVGLYVAGLASYLVAATTTWGLNRLWTFRGSGSGPVHRQWALFLATNAIGFVLNRGTYFALITFSTLCAEQPVLAILGGVAAGMFLNFHLSRTVVFR
jgi:putative flippase GtrA